MTAISIFSNFLIFALLIIISKSAFSLSFQSLDQNPNFETGIALFGDAQIVNGGSSVQLNRPMLSSTGLLIHSKPFKFVHSNPSSPMSFSTDFTFSISPYNGEGLALVIVPAGLPSKFPGKGSFGLSRENRFLGIEFDTSVDGNVGDENANHVGVDVCSLVSARVSNVSKINLVLNSGVKLRSWIDYHASLKRLDVRLSKLGDPRPDDPLLTYPIDLGKMWKEEEVFLGLISSSGNSLQATSVYSWRSKVQSVPKWMHSQPVNPQDYNNEHGEQKAGYKKSVCFLSGFFFAVGCGAFTALALLFLWAIFVDRATIIQADRSVCPVDVRYEKINVVVENSADDVKK